MTLRHLSHMAMLTGLLVVLTACDISSSGHSGPSPTTSAALPSKTPAAQSEPSPTPSPFGGASAQLGPPPQTCSPSSIHTLKTISSHFGPAVGAGAAWGVGFSSSLQGPLTLVWVGDDTSDHIQDGWSHKLLWIVATHLQGAVTIRGGNLQTGTPLFPDAVYAETASTPTTLILNPNDPAVSSQNPNQDDQWTQFPGGLTVPGAGCYALQASWPGGSWHLTFAAGLGPRSS